LRGRPRARGARRRGPRCAAPPIRTSGAGRRRRARAPGRRPGWRIPSAYGSRPSAGLPWRRLEVRCPAPSTRRTGVIETMKAVEPPRRLGPERLVEKRQADVHPVVDVRMRIVELLVGMPDAGGSEAGGQDAGAVVDVVLVA